MDQSAIPDGREGIDAADGRAALDRPTATPGWSSLSGITRALLLALTGIGLAYVGVCIYRHATTIIDAYDGSYNAMVARTVAFEHRYGVWDNREFIRWPVRVTTGAGDAASDGRRILVPGRLAVLAERRHGRALLGTLVLCWLFVAVKLHAAIREPIVLSIDRDRRVDFSHWKVRGLIHMALSPARMVLPPGG